jgi:Rrf2 family protein
MFISNTAQYAIRILLYMSGNPDRKHSATELIQELNISDKYLRRIMTGLTKAGFISSISGRNGGYIFEKDINEIKIGDIVFSVEGKEKYMQCLLGFDNCNDEHPCKLHTTWMKIRTDIFSMFDNISLKDLNEIKSARI